LQEFLKKEFSHENIYFWVACEKYRQFSDPSQRRQSAREIFERHLALGALEPVNVDWHARQVTQEQLGEAPPSLFLQAQKQIFNLMKFDSYPRFIKSELYKECVMRALSGEELPVQSGNSELQLDLPQSPNHTKNSLKYLFSFCLQLKKSRSDAEERRRKSLLPWARKTRAKSRDKGGTDASDVHELLDKRALVYTDFQVFLSYMNKIVDLEEEATILSGQEVRVEQRVVFRLDLPNRKTIAVKSKQCKTLGQVVRPILHKYGYRLEMVTLCLMSENEVVEPSTPVTNVDNQRIQVLTRSTPTESLTHLSGWLFIIVKLSFSLFK
ncbi:hypothetical protein AAG570_012996, partial [Ranatra chinensis]